LGGGLARDGACFARLCIAGLCTLGWLASRHSGRLWQYECGLREQHEFAGGVHIRNSTLEAEGGPSTWTALPSNTTSGAVFGGFVGYNWQWSELVVGWDLAYKRPASLNSTAGDSLRRLFDTSDSVRHDVTIDAQTSFKLVDYATLRGRAGYAFGEFLPYAVLGAAVGRFNYQTNVTVTDVMTDLTVAPPVPGDLGTFQQSASSGQKNVFVAGLTTGLGIDWAITPGVFLRAEWEYALFAPVNGTRSNINVGFVGLGARF
jgi:outer membrane immunogenic protein